MFISMISDLAALALAFMTFTASAQNVYLNQLENCMWDELPASPYNTPGASNNRKTIYLPDIEGSSGCLGACKNVSYSLGDFTNLVSVGLQDKSKCYFWMGYNCGPPGSYVESASGIEDGVFHCTSTPKLAVTQSITLDGKDPLWSFQCYAGSC